MERQSNSEYRCCFGFMHVKTATFLIAALSILGGICPLEKTLIALIKSALSDTVTSAMLDDAIYSVTGVFFKMVFAGMVIYGLKTNNAKLLKPFMYLQIFNLFLFAALFLLSIFRRAFDSSKSDVDCNIVPNVSFFMFCINLWFLHVVSRCYDFLLAHSRANAPVMKV